MGKLKKLGLVAHTVKYMTARQWFYRAYYALRPAVKPPKGRQLTPRSIPLGFAPGAQSGEDAESLLKLEFPLVSGYTAKFSGEVDWDLPGCEYRLQCFRLNSFDFLHTLAAAGEEKHIRLGFDLMEHWQRNAGKAAGDKWNAYPLAQRLCNWIGFASACGEGRLAQIAPWIDSQAQVLRKNIEYHLGANHLLTQGKALAWAGAFLKDEKLLEKGLKLLDKEYATQFLADGAHYEGSLSYHIESMQQYFETVMLLHCLGDSRWELWARRLQPNYAYLSGLLGADGTIPLYNDSAFDYCAEAKDFLATSALLYQTAAPGSQAGPYCRRWQTVSKPLAAQWPQPATRLYPQSGLFVDRFPGHSFYLRCGNLGPDCNLGHAHADQLSILWKTDAGEIFADSGVFTYQPGSLRTACRATAAHNTVELDGQSSAQVWGAFRTARRGYGRVTQHSGSSITAQHSGYKKILGDGLSHQRSYTRSSGRVILTDTLTAKKKAHQATLRFHLAPGCAAQALDEHRVLLAGKYTLECSEPVTLEPCRVAGRFGCMEESLCVTARLSFRGQAQIRTDIIIM